MRPTHVTSMLRNTAATAAVLIAALALAACSTSSNLPEPSGSSSASSTSGIASQAAKVVKLNGVAGTLPAGWYEAAPTVCGQAANTATRYPKPMPVAACPLGTQAGVPSIQLVAMFGPWGANGWGGTRTILGWRVADIEEAVHTLTLKGVEFTQYNGMDQDLNGIWTTPGGDKVARFTDPEGNNVSLTEFV